jgi:signal transduction histidine kinase
VEETVESIRNVMMELRPAVPDDYGLTASCAGTPSSSSGARDCDAGHREGDAAPTAAGCRWEALAHYAGGARKRGQVRAGRDVTVTLHTTPESSRLTLAGDGGGFDLRPAGRRGRATAGGLMIMREARRGERGGVDRRLWRRDAGRGSSSPCQVTGPRRRCPGLPGPP